MRIRFYLITITYALLTIPCLGQSPEQYSCEILKSIVLNKEIKVVLDLEKRENSFIAFIDSNNYFTDCLISDMFGKDIKILQKWPTQIDSKYLLIKVENIASKKKNIVVALYCKSYKLYGYVHLKLKKNKCIIKEVQIGDLD